MARIVQPFLCSTALMLAACPSSEEPPTPEATAEPSSETAAHGPGGKRGVDPGVVAERRATRAARTLGRTLKERLQAVLAESGPMEAVRVCSTEAREIAAEMEAHGGLRVGRASLRLRNPDNAPPAWVTAWLREQGERPAEGVTGIRDIDGRARFLAPIAVEPLCLTCHGPPESIAPAVRAALRERYPDDQAIGYAAGDLRGALWAEAEI